MRGGEGAEAFGGHSGDQEEEYSLSRGGGPRPSSANFIRKEMAVERAEERERELLSDTDEEEEFCRPREG